MLLFSRHPSWTIIPTEYPASVEFLFTFTSCESTLKRVAHQRQGQKPRSSVYYFGLEHISGDTGPLRFIYKKVNILAFKRHSPRILIKQPDLTVKLFKFSFKFAKIFDYKTILRTGWPCHRIWRWKTVKNIANLVHHLKRTINLEGTNGKALLMEQNIYKI